MPAVRLSFMLEPPLSTRVFGLEVGGRSPGFRADRSAPSQASKDPVAGDACVALRWLPR